MGLLNSNSAKRYSIKGNYFSSHPEITGVKSLRVMFTDDNVNTFYKKKLMRTFTWNEIISFEVDDQVTQSNSKRVTAITRDILSTTTGNILLETLIQGGSATSLMGSSANLAIALHTKSSNNVKRFVTERAKATSTTSFSQSFSEADEIAKYVKLKESGVITEEEFNAKKKQLLGL